MHPTDLTRLRAAAARRVSAGPQTLPRRIATYAGPAHDDAWNDEVPTPALELVLELEGTWDVDLAGHPAVHKAFVAGPFAGRVRTRPAGGAVRLVQVSLDPLSASAALGMPAGELTGEIASLGAVLGDAAADALLTGLHDAWDEHRRGCGAARLAAGWFRAQRDPVARPGSAPPADVQLAVALLDLADGNLAIDEVAALVGCSRRHLARRFATWVGLTPSDYRRLRRLARADELLRAAPRRALSEVAAECGYFDQAHLSRDVRALVGSTPALLAQRHAGSHAPPTLAA